MEYELVLHIYKFSIKHVTDSAARGEKTRESAKQGQRHRRADTNIISIDFRKIIAPSNMHTGDPVHCTSCDVILSSISKITTAEDKKVISWLKCCWSKNVLEQKQKGIYDIIELYSGCCLFSILELD